MPKTKKKFVDKKTSTTFRLVHRSQRDPLIAAGEENSLVLAPIDESKNAEEEHKFGIHYDDDYNYLQHLRDVNEVVSWEPVEERFRVFPDGQSVEAGVDLPIAPKAGKKLVLPSSIFETEGLELETGLLNQAAPSDALRLDWDPEVINALEDDFDFDDPSNVLDDDFVIKANHPSTSDGDQHEDEEMDNSDEWEDESTDSDATLENEKEKTPLGKKVNPKDDFSDFPKDHMDFGNEEETRSRFTEYSMTSSVIARNKGLKLLDDEFEKLYEKYDEEEMGNLDGVEDEIGGFIRPDSERMQKLIEQYQREKDEKIVVPGDMSVRQYIGEDSDESEELTESAESSGDEDEPMERIIVEEGNQPNWDCESILSTNSTLYNHPSLIKEPRVPKKIKVNPATGLPEGVLKNSGITSKGLKTLNIDGKSERSAATNRSKTSSYRPKDESCEDKKARKAEIRAIRRERRLEKKANNLVFKEEEQKQIQLKLSQAVNQSGLRLEDLAIAEMKGFVEGAKPLFPFFACGPVVRGFGRGSKQLGCPTANFPNYVVDRLPLSFPCGVYYGWASVNNEAVHKMVMSVGTNPHFHNNFKTMETHILHKFDSDFYGQLLKVVIVGFIRDMESFKSLDELIAAIDSDIQQAKVELDKVENSAYRSHSFFLAGGEDKIITGNSQVFRQMRHDSEISDPEDKSLQ